MPKVRVLAVGEDQADLEQLQNYLEADKESTICFEACQDPSEVLNKFSEQRFDIIVLDYSMAAINDGTLLKEIKDAGYRLPCIMLTEKDFKPLASKSPQFGAMDYLRKDMLSETSIKRSVTNALTQFNLKLALEGKQLVLEKAEAAKKRNNELLRFYQVLAHELKTPLAGISEFTSMLLDEIPGPLTAKQFQYLEIMQESCSLMTSNIRSLLDAAHLESGKLSFSYEQTDLQTQIHKVIKIMQPIAEKKRIELSLHQSSLSIDAYFDPARFKQALMNLVQNAIKFTDPGGQVIIASYETECAAGDKILTIEVRDSGVGISDGELKKIFSRFYQINSSEFDKEDGLGLGLNLCKGIIQGHGGEIWARSEVGIGSQFFFTIPRSAEQLTYFLTDTSPKSKSTEGNSIVKEFMQ